MKKLFNVLTIVAAMITSCAESAYATSEVNPYQIADAIIIVNPLMDHDLNRAHNADRVINVEHLKHIKGADHHMNIIHRGGYIIRPLEAGHKVKMFLKKTEVPGDYAVFAIMDFNEAELVK